MFYYYYCFNPYLRICLLILEGEEGREKHQSVASHSHPNQGSNWQSRFVP